MNPSFRDQELDTARLSRARRRRRSRMLTQLRADEREAFLEELAHQVTPTFEFYLLALLAGILIGLGFSFNQTALLVAGALVAPRMGPLIGLALAAISGSLRFFLRLLLSVAVLISLAAAGAAASAWLTASLAPSPVLAFAHARLNLLDFSVLALGAAILSQRLARANAVAPLASAAVAYEVLLPLGALGVGLARDLPSLWPGALLILAFHLTWTALIGLMTLFVLGFRPLVGSTESLAVAIALAAFVGLGGALGLGASVLAVLPTPTPTPTATGTPTSTPSATPSATTTATASLTPTPSQTPTLAPTMTPAPAFAVVVGTGGFGAFLRQAPDGPPVAGLLDGAALLVLRGPEVVAGRVWWHVRTAEGLEGWLLADFIATVTPVPSPTP